jgi:predicted amidohydrolase YtcJ
LRNTSLALIELRRKQCALANHCYTYFWGDVHVRNFGPARAAFISPVKAAKAKGIVFSNHTDFNVTPLDPFFVIWTAMARESRTGQVIGPEQRVDAYTKNFRLMCPDW